MLLRQIQCFCAVCEEGSFTKAARRLYITQSAVSQQMKNLETDLGVSLFQRGGRNLVLSEAGRVFYERTRTVISDIDQARIEVRAVAEHTSSRLR
ncbi:LysR family transcriptional regulator [Eggerthellaceae bacterium zg-1084]|uniref:LysR family transcriptional regulator n=1 Tax=Berryella wangjianweii TaxID=2734634 RepID=A0A6M8J2J6_9ACTN|nr:LysR family transcriptional regulator [Berryella wangjianweii]NPD31356.1 LysR family transcriptional regulator [Berryella wangjianweii]NPD32337.1 LysR family transcriptional regulator [Eggerthellaceae bacterium zg-997]QKF06893.1 LysR family transcriptional regulator [Berryella wangjianweii]